MTTQTQPDHLAQITALEAEIAQLTKRAITLVRLSAMHRQGRDQAREDLHAARKALSAIKGLCDGSESQGYVAVSDVRAAMEQKPGPA